ncbi:ubiquinone/menaquinone [Polychaeton citri CBS 116435]|uniref:2-methoxy-6-polyprenyl-1,4-benzoquinol methylase, mitochondrial n=1 Tax=Polychaeton citri CBS 116435 TaxID=1314669 RepID=A0A9P4Q4J8_9PEZI|nr:ubiquinone/menaquinone [Polychaeton citri CBS 116435]
MSSIIPRASKRLRLGASPLQWVCQSCKQRALYGSSSRLLQQKEKSNDQTTHFGFETIAESMKNARVGAVFSSVASSYDTMNDLMSLGIHRLWKDHFVRSLSPGVLHAQGGQGQRILDIAGGSGDIATRMLDHATEVKKDNYTSVIVSDINSNMLAEGRKRFSASSYKAEDRVSFLEANAEELKDVESNSIDLYTVAFGIRNFTHKDKALREAFRVLKPGGVFACLEFAPTLNNPLANAIYKRWSFSMIPLIGQVVAADRDSYQYLVESIEQFPSQEQFATMIREAGFLLPGQGRGEPSSEMRDGGAWEDLTMGIASIHKGIKPL